MTRQKDNKNSPNDKNLDDEKDKYSNVQHLATEMRKYFCCIVFVLWSNLCYFTFIDKRPITLLPSKNKTQF